MPRRLPARSTLLAAAAVALLALPSTACRRTAPPPVLGTLPPFTLTSQADRPFGSEDLRGKVWVANFIFTRCPTVCPVFTAQMAGLQRDLAAKGAAEVRLVSFSVDPSHDTPERLAEYGTRHGADFERWTFLTGEPDAIKTAVVEGLKIAAEPVGPDDDLASVFHGSHFVLVDGEGRIRGYYASEDEHRVEALLREAVALARLQEEGNS